MERVNDFFYLIQSNMPNTAHWPHLKQPFYIFELGKARSKPNPSPELEPSDSYGNSNTLKVVLTVIIDVMQTYQQ